MNEVKGCPQAPRLPLGVLRRGRDEPPPEKIGLRAGPLTLILEGGSLRYIRLGNREVLRMVYSAVRDRDWCTVPAVLSDLRVEARDDSFDVTYVSEHKQGEVDFAWKGTIRGKPDGTIRFAMDGEARSTFLRSRIGFCVLHPMAECAGAPSKVEKADGRVERGVFPKLISPLAPFKDIRAISHEVVPGVWARVRFEGEIFEMEDQRNWGDASYKTFCTPLALPYPVEVRRGARIEQAVELQIEDTVSAPGSSLSRTASTAMVRRPAVRFEIGTGPAKPLPLIGLCAASHGLPLTAKELARLRFLHLSHLRTDLRLGRPDWTAALRRAIAEAEALGVPLEAALHLSSDPGRELEDLAGVLEAMKPSRPRFESFLIHREGEGATSEPWVQHARTTLLRAAPEAKIGGGTDAELVEINRRRLPVELLDRVCFSMNPQVHVFDDDSLVEALAAQGTAIESARALARGVPLAITPVTLKRRFNPDATGPPRELGPCELPPQVDPRQMSLFGAGWTAGSLKYIAEGGVASVTYFETTGWRGVMEIEGGSPDPVCFRSLAGAVFPLYHVLADAGEFHGGEVVPSESSEPLAIDGIALRGGKSRRVLLANFSPSTQEVAVHGLVAPVRVRMLDETSVEEAMATPERFRRGVGAPLLSSQGVLVLRLLPYAVARMDSEESQEV